MEILFRNKTILTEDMYKSGVVGNYKLSHKLLRAMSTAYAIVLFFIGYAFLHVLDLVLAIPFILFAAAIFLWNGFGYKYAAKKSFKEFARMHNSHYEVEMDYCFYEDRIEQETTKTQGNISYDKISIVNVFNGMMVIVFNKQAAILDVEGFQNNTYEEVINFLSDKKIKVKVFK